MKVLIDDLKDKIYRAFTIAGINNKNSKILTDIFIRATLRGVGHHDIDSVYNRAKSVIDNKINGNPEFRLASSFGALESYDGDNGLGELCTHFVMERSIEIAQKLGIGLVTIRNSNHFLSAAPFNEIANERGFFTIVMSKSPAGLSLPGADKNIIGNNPFGFSAGYKEGNILFDICCAYSSYGKMQEKVKNNQKVPAYWGNDTDGKPTTNPADIFKSGLYMPIGEHKGFGLAIMVEILTAIISNGAILNQGYSDTGFKGEYSQTAITINVEKLLGSSEFENRNLQMVQLLKNLYPDIYIPGDRSVAVKDEILKRGYFEIDDRILEELNSL